MPRVFTLGICGGLCTGKSVTCAALQRLGAKLINADEVAHRAYLPGTECYSKLIETFGGQIVPEHGAPINRKVLGAMVFGQDKGENLSKLNSIVWPEIERLIGEEIDGLRQGLDKRDVVVALEAALMLEAGWHKYCDQLWLMVADPEVVCKRIMERNGLSKEEAQSRIRAQMSNADRISRAEKLFPPDRLLVFDRTTIAVEEALRKLEEAWGVLLEKYSLRL